MPRVFQVSSKRTSSWISCRRLPISIFQIPCLPFCAILTGCFNCLHVPRALERVSRHAQVRIAASAQQCNCHHACNHNRTCSLLLFRIFSQHWCGSEYNQSVTPGQDLLLGGFSMKLSGDGQNSLWESKRHQLQLFYLKFVRMDRQWVASDFSRPTKLPEFHHTEQ